MLTVSRSSKEEILRNRRSFNTIQRSEHAFFWPNYQHRECTRGHVQCQSQSRREGAGPGRLGVTPPHGAMSHAVRGARFHPGATTLRTFHHLQGPLCYTAGAAASSPSHRAGPGVDFLESVLIAVSVLLRANAGAGRAPHFGADRS